MMAALRVVKSDAPAPPEKAATSDDDVLLYGLPNCDTCRKARRWLDRKGVAFRFIDYRAEPVTSDTLHRWTEKLGAWDALINRASTTWRQLPDARKSPGSAAEWIVLLRDHPALIKRPVLVTPDGAVSVGFKDTLFAARLGTAES